MQRIPIREGEITQTVYSHIKDHQYDDAVRILHTELQQFPHSRAALSLLGYCYYHMQDFQNAAQMYSQLTSICPEVSEYGVYHAQSLLKAGMYEEASQLCTSLAPEVANNPNLQERLVVLQAMIAYDQDDASGAKTLIDYLSDGGATHNDKKVFEGAILWKDKRHADALKVFQDAMNAVGYSAELTYNIALCYYSMKQFGPALKFIAEIIEKGVRDHPELSIGAPTGENIGRSVGNTSSLKETALIEAFNLKAAIEFNLKNEEAAREALNDMPPRNEAELDPVTLHNQALFGMDSKPSEGFRKLNFLLQGGPESPQETFVNLLLLYCKYGYFDLAADILAENSDLTYKYLEGQDFAFLDSLILAQSSHDEAIKRFEELSQKHIETLRRDTRNIQDARRQRDQNMVKKLLHDFDEALNKYIPVLMGQAKIYWDLEQYSQVERIFRQSAEFSSEHEAWKLNVAHVFFMQEKFKECIRYYDPFVRKHQENLLSVTAIILANLCVAYVMTSANEEAEELMRLVEKEEEKITDTTKPVYHLCIINLVIGTLYCAKGNFEFGISRIIKSLEPYERKLGVDTWYYAKRCFLALGETLSKNMILLKDEAFDDILNFFDAAASVGKNIATTIAPLDIREEKGPKRTIAKEARLLKKFFLKMRD